MMFPDPDTDYCRLCLQDGNFFVNMGTYEIYMLKQCVPDIMIDITEKPMKMCRECSTHLSDFYRIQRVWQKMQKKLLSHFINLATKVPYQNQRFKPFHRQPVNTCKNKMYCRRNGTLELYKQIEQVTLYPTPPFKATVKLPEFISFYLTPKDDYRLVPISESAKLVEGILMVPNQHFEESNAENIHLVLRRPKETNEIIGKIGYAIVFFSGSKQAYFTIEEFTETRFDGLVDSSSSTASIPEFGDVAGDCQQMAPPDIGCAVKTASLDQCAVNIQQSLGASSAPIPDINEGLSDEKEMAPPDVGCAIKTELPEQCAVNTSVPIPDPNSNSCVEFSANSNIEKIPASISNSTTEQGIKYDALLSGISEIPEDTPDYVSITRCRQREDGKIVMMNEEETVVGQIISYPEPKPPPCKKIRITKKIRKTKPALKLEDCFAKITDFKINSEGDYIEDHDYLANPYKINNLINDFYTYCNICRKPHTIIYHESHMKNHGMWRCDWHKELKFDNIFMLNQHLGQHIQTCKLCKNLIITGFEKHCNNHRVFRPPKKRQQFMIPRIAKVESLCNSESANPS